MSLDTAIKQKENIVSQMETSIYKYSQMEKQVEILEKENSIFRCQLNSMVAKEFKDIEQKLAIIENTIMEKNPKAEYTNTGYKNIEIISNNKSTLIIKEYNGEM